MVLHGFCSLVEVLRLGFESLLPPPPQKKYGCLVHVRLNMAPVGCLCEDHTLARGPVLNIAHELWYTQVINYQFI